MTRSTTPQASYRLPTGLLEDTRLAAAELGTTTTAVVIAALDAYLAEPATPALLAAGRLIEVEQFILTGDATSTPWGLRMPESLRDRVAARADSDQVTATSVLVAALTAYVVGPLADVQERFAGRLVA